MDYCYYCAAAIHPHNTVSSIWATPIDKNIIISQIFRPQKLVTTVPDFCDAEKELQSTEDFPWYVYVLHRETGACAGALKGGGPPAEKIKKMKQNPAFERKKRGFRAPRNPYGARTWRDHFYCATALRHCRQPLASSCRVIRAYKLHVELRTKYRRGMNSAKGFAECSSSTGCAGARKTDTDSSKDLCSF